MLRDRALLSGVICAAVIFGCGRESPSADSSTTQAAVTSSAADSAWVPEVGDMLVVPGDSENSAVVLFPTAPSARLVSSRALTLFNTAGDSIGARLAMTPADAQVCGDAPIIHMRDVVRVPWSVGLLGRNVAALKLDSIEAMPPGDSAKLAADLSRLASGIALDAGSRFQGLPFAVLTARRAVVEGKDIVLAHLVRRVNQEASPMEEHTLVVAERAKAGDAATLAFSQRSEGKEETAEHFEILALERGAHSVLALVARDQESQTRYELLERSPDGTWRVRWNRTLAC